MYSMKCTAQDVLWLFLHVDNFFRVQFPKWGIMYILYVEWLEIIIYLYLGIKKAFRSTVLAGLDMPL